MTAVTRTKLSNSVTVGQEGFDVEDTTLAVNGRIVLRADQNANNVGKVTMKNNAANMKSWQVDVYYNPDTMPNSTMHGVDYLQKMLPMQLITLLILRQTLRPYIPVLRQVAAV